MKEIDLRKTFNVEILIFYIISMSGKLVFNEKMIKFKLASLASYPSEPLFYLRFILNTLNLKTFYYLVVFLDEIKRKKRNL